MKSLTAKELENVSGGLPNYLRFSHFGHTLDRFGSSSRPGPNRYVNITFRGVFHLR